VNEDQLANALSLTLVPHMPLKVTHVGALSHWKGCHSSESVRCAVFFHPAGARRDDGPGAAVRGQQGLFEHLGRFKELRLPAASRTGEWS